MKTILLCGALMLSACQPIPEGPEEDWLPVERKQEEERKDDARKSLPLLLALPFLVVAL